MCACKERDARQSVTTGGSITRAAGGFAINLGGRFRSLKVDGGEHIRVYRARVGDTGDGPGLSPLERRFCGECGSMLWCWDPRWPDLVHPFASAIDTELPVPPERTHLMLESVVGRSPGGTQRQDVHRIPG
jgi:hypothetical protein